MNRSGVLLIALAASGCLTTHLSEDGAVVRITNNPQATAGCRFLGNVEASDNRNTGVFREVAVDSNENALRNYAANLGADTVLVGVMRGTMWNGVKSRGEAYRCSGSVPERAKTSHPQPTPRAEVPKID